MKNKLTYGVLLGGKWSKAFAESFLSTVRPNDQKIARVFTQSSIIEERDALSLSLKEHVEMLGGAERELAILKDRVRELEGEVKAGAHLVARLTDKVNDLEAKE